MEKVKEIWRQCETGELCLAKTDRKNGKMCILYGNENTVWREEDFDNGDRWNEYKVKVSHIEKPGSLARTAVSKPTELFAKSIILIRENDPTPGLLYYREVLKNQQTERLAERARQQEIEEEEEKVRSASAITIGGEAVNEASDPDFFEEILAVKKKTKKEIRSDRTVKVMQWNQKFLSYIKGNSTSEQQIVNISLTIQREDPDVVIMEEIMGENGEQAVEKIKEMLNKGGGRGTGVKKAALNKEYSVNQRLGALSNKSKGVYETFACLYRKDVVGDLTTQVLFKYGFSPTEDAFIHNKNVEAKDVMMTRITRELYKEEFKDEKDRNYFEIPIGDAIINVDEAMNVFEEYKGNCKNRWWFNSSYLENNYEDVGFDYKPVLFTFSGTAHKPGGRVRRFHVVGVHGSTGEKRYGDKKYPVREQNVMECVYLQSLCAQAALEKEFVLLLGDFNTQEAANFGNMGLWDMDMNLPTNVGKDRSWLYKETELLRRSRENFLDNYGRAIDPRLPTNVFPSLAGLCVIPKHNDDIWVPKKMDGWKFSPGKCARIPGKVLEAWDNEAQDYYIKAEVCIDGDTSHSGVDEEEEFEEKKEMMQDKVRSFNEKVAKLLIERDELKEELEKKSTPPEGPPEGPPGGPPGGPSEGEEIESLNESLTKNKKELKQVSQELKKLNQALDALDKSGEKSGADKRKAAKINAILAKLWSDHRPVVASFECCDLGAT